MDLNEIDFTIFDDFFKKRPEVSIKSLKADIQRYYSPFIQKLIALRKQKNSAEGIIVGVSAIQGAGKSTQGEILEILLKFLGLSSVHLSIDDHYITHDQLNELRDKDPRFIRRGVTHDVTLAIQNLTDLKKMVANQKVELPIYDKGVFEGDGDRNGFKIVDKKPEFIFYDGWMLGAKRVSDESVFEKGYPALDTPEHIQFAKDVNNKLDQYIALWDLIDFMNVLYVPHYEMSLVWRDQAEEILRAKGEGMSHEQIKEFIYYFWRSVHPAIQIKNLAFDEKTDQVVIINDNHSIGEILTSREAKKRYF